MTREMPRRVGRTAIALLCGAFAWSVLACSKQPPPPGTCEACGTTNELSARFCAGCGESLVELCPGCGSEIRAGVRFCPECGCDVLAKSQADAEFKAAGGLVIYLGGDVSMRLVEIKPGRFLMGSSASEETNYARFVEARETMEALALVAESRALTGEETEAFLAAEVVTQEFAEPPVPPASNRLGHKTQHEVTISKAFWLGQTEVTQAQWEAVMGSNPSYFKGNPNHPVECVSWNDAQEFCRKLSQKTGMTFRLPTEAEWEYACRAGTTMAYSFGNDASRLGEYAWFKDNSGRSTKPVATKKPNPWGLYDMHGNVREWCSDRYGKYPGGATKDPQGPSSGSSRVLRGGSWFNDSLSCRAATRVSYDPGGRGNDDGFRVARTP